jgi:UTP--glucose-1-phosphate uridylyltransferase
MLPITRSIPKEMLPVGRKPMLQHVVEEAVASGVTQICIVIRVGKEIIRDYFSSAGAAARRDNEQAAQLESLLASCELTFVYQQQPLGLGDALLQAREFVGDEAFVMMLPDQQVRAPVAAAAQLLRRWQPGAAIWSSLLRLPKEDARFFVGARGVEYEEIEPGRVTISRLCTEDETRRAHVGLSYEARGFGRTIFPPEIFDYLGAEFANPQTGEVDLLKSLEKSRGVLKNYGIWLEGEPFDLGTFDSYYHYLPKLWEIESRQVARLEPQAEL